MREIVNSKEEAVSSIKNLGEIASERIGGISRNNVVVQ